MQMVLRLLLKYFFKNIEEYNSNKKHKILIAFYDKVADMLNNKKPNSTELFIKCRKLIISLFFIKQYYFYVPKNIRLYSTHYFIMKIPNKQELHQIVFNHSSDIDFKDFMNLDKKCTAKSYSYLVIDVSLASDTLLHSRRNFLKRIQKLFMTIEDKTRDKKLQYDIKREEAKISAL